jgi:hypothetical protein
MSAEAIEVEAAVAALYRLPLGEFVAARDQLARQLRAAGDREAARQVAGLRRPSISAWAANQLAHAAPNAMAELLDAGAALQAAQQAALAGQPGAARSLRTAHAHLRAAIARLTQRAETLLVRAGHAASDATLTRLGATLQAAATGEQGIRAALAAGRLAGDLDPAGFGLPAMATPELATDSKPEPAPPQPEPDAGRVDQQRARARQAAARALAGTRRAAEQAGAALAQAQAVADRQQQAARVARQHAEQLAERARDLEERAARAVAAAAEAQQQADAAAQDATAAVERVAVAEEAASAAAQAHAAAQAALEELEEPPRRR